MMEDLFERLSRMMMRRKYARVDEDRAGSSSSSSLLMRSKTVKVSSRNSKSERTAKSTHVVIHVVSEAAPVPVPVPVALVKPKRYTLRSSNNEAIDGAWFNNALRRSVAEGRLNLSTVL